MPIFELDPVDEISVAAVGQPGQRQFFLLAKGRGRTLTLSCEKVQIQALIVRLHQMMEAQGIEVPERAPRKAALSPGGPRRLQIGWPPRRTSAALRGSPGPSRPLAIQARPAED